MRQNMGDVRMWDVQFQHWVNDWEVELVGVFLHQLELHIPLNEDGDPLRKMETLTSAPSLVI